jgi:hypothetical protein
MYLYSSVGDQKYGGRRHRWTATKKGGPLGRPPRRQRPRQEAFAGSGASTTRHARTDVQRPARSRAAASAVNLVV